MSVVLRRSFVLKKTYECGFYNRLGRQLSLSVITPNRNEFRADVEISDTRNFSIIAHIDHGKSTLADRLLETAGNISKSAGNKQVLDKIQVERERGITIKAKTATMMYNYDDKTYLLNLIDTPGHVDFTYEVSRALSACQGVLLLVDATQGVQAQTAANFYLAKTQGLKIIPVINKIDAANANIDSTMLQMASMFGLEMEDMLQVSAKEGTNIRDVFESVIKRIDSPSIIGADEPTVALLFDTWYDQFKGVVCVVAMKNGQFSKGDKIVAAHSGLQYDIMEVGFLTPDPIPRNILQAGQVGYLHVNMKSVKEAVVGDTFHIVDQPPSSMLPGFRKPTPMVFAGLYPESNEGFSAMRTAIEKLLLTDYSISLSYESSVVLGAGFRVGCLGLLHLDVFRQRLEQEYDQTVILTHPTVPFKARLKTGSEVVISSPSEFPPYFQVETFLEPMVLGTIIVPTEYMSSVISMALVRRGQQTDYSLIDEHTSVLKFSFPLNEIITDFFGDLKRITSGYASFDYEDSGYLPTKLVKVEVLFNGKAVDALSTIVHEEKSLVQAKDCVSRLHELIPRQMFEVVIQASVRGKVVARDVLKPYRKDVLAKLYAADLNRKRKRLDAQKESKKKMKRIGVVDVPYDVFVAMMTKNEPS